LFLCVYILKIIKCSWSRWPEIIQHNDFREGWKESDVEDLARIVVSNLYKKLNTVINVVFYFQILYCLRFYRGDEKIRSFIWDLIIPDNISVEDSPSHGGKHHYFNLLSYIFMI